MTTMKIIGGTLVKEMPIEMLLPYEKHAIRNHGQSLHRIADRGGLTASEALAILGELPARFIVPSKDDDQKLYLEVQEYKNGLG